MWDTPRIAPFYKDPRILKAGEIHEYHLSLLLVFAMNVSKYSYTTSNFNSNTTDEVTGVQIVNESYCCFCYVIIPHATFHKIAKIENSDLRQPRRQHQRKVHVVKILFSDTNYTRVEMIAKKFKFNWSTSVRTDQKLNL